MKIDKGNGRSALRQVLIRPGAHGKRGKPIKFEVNYIPLLLEKMVSTAYHYDVDIQPMASRKWQRAAFKRFEIEALAGQPIAFDGNKNAYTAKKLKLDHYKKEVVVREDNRDRKFTITMKEAAVVDLQCLKSYMQAGSGNANLVKPMRAIQCLDVVLRTAYELNPRFVKFRKSIYVVPSKPEDIGANHELWYGLFQSALLGSKPFLNIDVSHKAFPRGGPVLDVVASFNRSVVPTTLNEWGARDVHDYLKGMEVVYTGPDGVGKTYKYNSLKGPASSQIFKLEDGTETTVAAYLQKKGYRLKFPDLPVMHVGSTIRNIMVPMEMCAIPPGQALIKKHPDSCTQMIIRRSATDTITRKKKIMDIFTQIDYNNSKTIKDFGFGVGNSFEIVDGRVIPPPTVQYRNNCTITPQRGQWRADNASFIQINPQPLRWRILNLDSRTRPDAIQMFGQNIFQVSKKHGIQLEQFSMQQTYYEPRDLRNAIRQLDSIFDDLKRQKMDFVIVVISAMGDHYSKVKQRAELETGLLTQCVKGDTLFRKAGDMSTINNIWLKINAKTNGTNHVLNLGSKPPLIRKRVMYVGADVTHPSPEQTNIPSVVGVAASYDMEGFRYNCCYRLQNPKDEMIRDLENIIKKQLLQFKACNGALPELIMYFRDGVSEGQFSEILTIELNAIQSAIAATGTNAKVAVTFIVVQKRHHARFFPTRGTETEGKNQNLPPGTVVDKHITAPNQYQFFLISHQAVQGVAKPTKYCVLYDDVNSDPDELQAVTYALCHMFARCNRSVSYPAPTYYAHLAAFRGRVYIKDRRLDMNNLAGEYRKMQIKPEIIDGHPMFFV